MTNIMGFTFNPEPLEGPQQLALPGLETKVNSFAVVISDGLGSNGTGTEVSAGYQKVFLIGNSFLLGTGDANKIQFVADELKERKPGISTVPRYLSEETIRIAEKYFKFQPGEGLNFIVCGPEEGKTELYSIATGSITKPIRRNYMFDGCGAPFVGKAIERDQERGLRYINKPNLSIADATSVFFDLGLAATKSSGVNDQLQFGFILPEGTAALYHPTIHLTMLSKEYCDEKGQLDPRKVERNNEFYNQLTQRLFEIRRIQWDFNRYSTALQSGSHLVNQEGAIDVLKDCTENLTRLRSYVNQMIQNYVIVNNPK